jgi:hypothetical protein
MDLFFKFQAAVPLQSDALPGRLGAEEALPRRKPQKGPVDRTAVAVIDIEVEQPAERMGGFERHAPALDRCGLPFPGKESAGAQGVETTAPLDPSRQSFDQFRSGPADEPPRAGRALVLPGKIEGQ